MKAWVSPTFCCFRNWHAVSFASHRIQRQKWQWWSFQSALQWALWASIRACFLAIFSLEDTFSACLKSIFGCQVASAVKDSCWVSRIFLFLIDDFYYLWLTFPDKGSKEVLDLKTYLTSSNEPLGWRRRKLSFFSTSRVNKEFLKLQ